MTPFAPVAIIEALIIHYRKSLLPRGATKAAVPRPAGLPTSAGLGVSARWLDSHIALGARFAMQQAVLPVRDGLAGGHDLARSGYQRIPLPNGQTIRTPEGGPAT